MIKGANPFFLPFPVDQFHARPTKRLSLVIVIPERRYFERVERKELTASITGANRQNIAHLSSPGSRRYPNVMVAVLVVELTIKSDKTFSSEFRKSIEGWYIYTCSSIMLDRLEPV
jgi:hypothetical protein